MTEFELESLRLSTIQTVMSMADVQSTHISIYLTIVFAYIVVAYVAGSQLSRFQLSLVTFVFVAACFWELMMITTLGQAATSVGAGVALSADTLPPLSDAARKWFSRLLWSSGMIAALIFMWNVRSSGEE